MDALDIFSSTKKVEKIVLPYAHSKKNIPVGMKALKKELNKNVPFPSESGKDYVEHYVKEEERQLLESFNPACTMHPGEHRLDEVSQGTTPVVQELVDNQMKIYKTYNFSHRVKPLANLTISSMKDKILAMIETNPVVVIQGPTGCGKTTQVPQYILDSCYKKKQHCNIIVTQPRRIAAISIAKHVSEERQWPLGTLVGFQVGMIKDTSADTRLTYCTTGVLLHKLINAKNMLEYTHVILDEVHERDQDMDFLLLVVRKLLRTNSRSVKVILMSATIDVDKFAKYFSSPAANKLIPAPVSYIEKRSYYNVNIYYLSQLAQLGNLPEVVPSEPNVSHQMMEFCRRLIIVLDDIDKETDDTRDIEEETVRKRHVILIFLPGINEIEEMHNLLSDTKYKSSKWDIVVLHSTITNEEQQRIFDQPPKDYRRIILSTNIAESSITVPDVKYVIDFCLTKQLVIDPKTNFQSLELAWASKANCDQRAGRTGRVMDGRVYRLVPKNFFDEVLSAEADPEILRAPLENLILKAKILDMGEPKAILALSLDPPDLSNLERSILILKEAGALLNRPGEMRQYDGEITDLGRIMAQLPLDIHITKLIMLGHVYSILRETIIIGACMSTKNMFTNPFGKKVFSYTVKLTWAQDSASDCIAFMNVYKVWMNEKASRRVNSNASEKNWAQRNCVQIRVLREVDALVQEITSRLQRMGVKETVGINKVVWTESERPFILKVVIAGAFYPNYFVRTFRGVDNQELEGVKVLGGLDPLKTVYLQGWPFNQPGPLYARRIQEIFGPLSSATTKVNVSFDSSARVYVRFSNAEETVNKNTATSRKISSAVYKAVKMRQCGTPIEIPVLNEEEAGRRAEKLNIMQKKSLIFINDQDKSESNAIVANTKPLLPTLDETYVPLIIINVLDPGHFWVRVSDDDNREKLQNIQAALNNPKESFEPFDKAPEPGAIVVAPYNVGTEIEYCRAMVEAYEIKLEENFAQVLHIDYGYKGPVRACDLRQLKPELSRIPALALECVLANVKPSVQHCSNGAWSPAAYDMFHKLISEKVQIFGEIYSVVNSVIALKLHCKRKDGSQYNVNDFLIEKGFAVFKEEDYLSRSSHHIRSKHMDMTVEQKQYYEELQYDQDYLIDGYPEPPAKHECVSRVRLRGPFSPLEIELSHLAIAGRGKKVRIDTFSVNSVLLDPEMEDTHDRLLVAGNVNQSANGGSLQLRNTTLMPNMPGLAALFSLIFCPYMELRRNEAGTYYVGALCGLGYDPRTKASIFPEHDMEIHFSNEITVEDLQEINKLRHWMSVGMQQQLGCGEEANLQEIIACQNRIKIALFKLMEKNRKPESFRYIENFDKWSLYDESLFLSPGKVAMVRNNVYSLHKALELEERNVEIEELANHVAELRTTATGDASKVMDVHCKLCNTYIFGIFALRNHLFSEEHRQREEKLNIQ